MVKSPHSLNLSVQVVRSLVVGRHLIDGGFLFYRVGSFSFEDLAKPLLLKLFLPEFGLCLP